MAAKNKFMNAMKMPAIADMFSSEADRQRESGDLVTEVPLSELHPFVNHPFEVRDDEDMQKLVDSIKENGVLTNLTVRPRAEGGYEIISGHRRFHAAQLAGLDKIKVQVRDVDDDQAIIDMVDANIQREHISPMEKARAYAMKLEAISHQGERRQETSNQVGWKLESAHEVGQQAGDSGTQVRRYRVVDTIESPLQAGASALNYHDDFDTDAVQNAGLHMAVAQTVVEGNIMAAAADSAFVIGKQAGNILKDLKDETIDAKDALKAGGQVLRLQGGKSVVKIGGATLRSTEQYLSSFQVSTDDFTGSVPGKVKEAATNTGNILKKITNVVLHPLRNLIAMGKVILIGAAILLFLIIVSLLGQMSGTTSTSVFGANRIEDIQTLVQKINDYRNAAVTEGIYQAFQNDVDPNGNPYGYDSLTGQRSNNLQHGVTWNYANGIYNDTAEIISLAAVYYQQDWPRSELVSAFGDNVPFTKFCRALAAYAQPSSLRGGPGNPSVGINLDCSSFVQYCYWAQNLLFSAGSTAAYRNAADLVSISPSEVQPGDLRVVYASGGEQGHVQMALGGGAWIECCYGYGVAVNMSNTWMESRPCYYFRYAGF